ncbi:MAG: GGDEF domain-containing protein [Alphaproteobacteria bacterium]|nr:GGDEF domain-containing protein [Alphaproteobacteria bacterium]
MNPTIPLIKPSTKLLYSKILILFAVLSTADWFLPAKFDMFDGYELLIMFSAWMGGAKYGIATAAFVSLNIILQVLLREDSNGFDHFFLIGHATHIVVITAVIYAVSYARHDHLAAVAGARTDPLTGLGNRTVLMERLAIEFHRFNRGGHPFVLAFMDIDGFKQVNDKHGHDIGDQVLRSVAMTILRHIRPFDVATRIGGDEFCILIADTCHNDGLESLQRLQSGLRAAMEERNWPVTFSIGMVEAADQPEGISAIVSQADQLMYEAKRSGKNKIVHRGGNE